MALMAVLKRSLLVGLVGALCVSVPVLATPAKSPPNAVKVDPRSYEMNEKGVRAVEAKKFEQAEVLFKQALDTDRSNVTAAYNLAGIYITNRKEPAAVKLLEEYTRSYPSDAGVWLRLGDAYFATKVVPKAIKAYEAAHLIDPKLDGLAAKLATVYSLTNRLADAERMLLTAVEEQPKNAQLLSNLSSIFLATGKTDQAISTAKRGLQVKATPELYVTLGNAYELKKDLKNSLISFQRAQDLGSKTPELSKKIEQLKERIS